MFTNKLTTKLFLQVLEVVGSSKTLAATLRLDHFGQSKSFSVLVRSSKDTVKSNCQNLLQRTSPLPTDCAVNITKNQRFISSLSKSQFRHFRGINTTRLFHTSKYRNQMENNKQTQIQKEPWWSWFFKEVYENTMQITLQRPGELAPRWSGDWWKEKAVIWTVFAITGSSTMVFVKPFLKDYLKMEGSLKDGPWKYRLTYVAAVMPSYSLMLLFVGTLFGRHMFFRRFIIKMWSRFLPSSVRQKLLKMAEK